jgi:hypothetical protein
MTSQPFADRKCNFRAISFSRDVCGSGRAQEWAAVDTVNEEWRFELGPIIAGVDAMFIEQLV